MNHLAVVALLSFVTNVEADSKEVSIVFGGDVDFSRIVRYIHDTRDCPYSQPLKRLRPYISSADFAMVNFETTLGKPSPNAEINAKTGTGLWSDVSILPAFKDVGISHVGLANNHVQDFEDIQCNQTISYLNKYGITHSGIVYGKEGYYNKQKPTILKKNGVKIGILSYCDLDLCRDEWENMNVGPALFKLPNVISEVKSLREQEKCDAVVLFLHWGMEYTAVAVTGIIGIIKNLTKNADIDLIVGSHPHVTQKHWYAGKTLVATSLGNLFFTPFMLATYNFNERPPENDAEDKSQEKKKEDFVHFERIVYKQLNVMDDATRHGRLLKVVFDREGIVKQKSKYIGTEVFTTKNHCLATRVETDSKWQQICGTVDKECTGTPMCNYVKCDDEEPLPPSSQMPPSPHAESKTNKKYKKRKEDKLVSQHMRSLE